MATAYMPTQQNAKTEQPARVRTLICHLICDRDRRLSGFPAYEWLCSAAPFLGTSNPFSSFSTFPSTRSDRITAGWDRVYRTQRKSRARLRAGLLLLHRRVARSLASKFDLPPVADSRSRYLVLVAEPRRSDARIREFPHELAHRGRPHTLVEFFA